jgi:hypothetical protein
MKRREEKREENREKKTNENLVRITRNMKVE